MIFKLTLSLLIVASAVLAEIDYVKPEIDNDKYHFMDTFDELSAIGDKWIKSLAKKDGVDDSLAKYDGEWSIESAINKILNGDMGLVLKSKARHHAISSSLNKPFVFDDKPLIVQYEVKFQTAQECGGAYAKLLANDAEEPVLEQFFDKTSYSIMFGPDKCGMDKKLHFIIRFKNPVTGKYEEKHAKKTDIIDAVFNDGRTHLFTLILRPDHKYQLFIDRKEVNSGSILSDMEPSILPPKEIIDPEDSKPENWDDREKIEDPTATKPDDWDESEPKLINDPNPQVPQGWLENEPVTIADPDAEKPLDWDDETDGEWEAPKVDNPACAGAVGCGKYDPPQIPNPKYKGIWRAPLIENQNYQGIWEPRKIENPEYFEVENVFKSLPSFSAVGLELWSMTENILFDNFIISDDEKVVEKFTKDSWEKKNEAELEQQSKVKYLYQKKVNKRVKVTHFFLIFKRLTQRRQTPKYNNNKNKMIVQLNLKTKRKGKSYL
jgi:calnexin